MTLTSREEAEEGREMESLRVHADALLSLSSPASPAPSSSSPSTAAAGRRALAAEGVFECKTCSKRFPSFQALGGHRTSHTRLQARMLLHEEAAGAGERDKARVHECAVCGLEFSMGQALGGHMRRHRGEPAASSGAAPPDGEQQPETMPDLNFPPLEGGGGGGEDSSAPDRGSEPQLLNLLV